MLPSCALEMLNGHRKWREKAGNDAENGIFIIKASFITCYINKEGKVFLSWGAVQGCS